MRVWLLVLLASRVSVVLGVRLQYLVPPGKGGGVVPYEVHMVEVMETSSGIERDQMERIERDVIPTVYVDGLQQAEGDPGP